MPKFLRTGLYQWATCGLIGCGWLFGTDPLLSQGCTSSPAGLVAWWPGEGDGGDLAGENNGQLTGSSVTALGSGRVGLCFQLAANGDGVSVGNPAGLQLQEFSVEAWVQRSSSVRATYDSSGNGVLFGYGYNGYAFGMYDDGRLLLSKVGVSAISSSAAVRDTNWHHLAVTKSAGTVTFFIDGVGEVEGSYDPGFAFTAVAMIEIGRASCRERV